MLRLGIWIGLDFEGYSKGKRPLRRLRRGVIAFGQENLPIRVHGVRHVAVEETVPAAASPPRRLVAQPIRRLDLAAAGPATAAGDTLGASPDTPYDNQGAPACCRGPSVEPGAQGGDGTGDGRTDEPISGMVQFRTVSNVGATGFEQPPIRSGKTEIRVFGGAESGALAVDAAPAHATDPLLAALTRAWPRLTAEARLRIAEIAAAGILEVKDDHPGDSDGTPPRSGKTKIRRRGAAR